MLTSAAFFFFQAAAGSPSQGEMQSELRIILSLFLHFSLLPSRPPLSLTRTPLSTNLARSTAFSRRDIGKGGKESTGRTDETR